MKIIETLIDAGGGLARLKTHPIRVPETDGLMRLTIEHIGAGPRGLPLLSVAHYFEQNGDLICDPDMTFEVEAGPGGKWLGWHPVSIQHSTGRFFEYVKVVEGRVLVDPRGVRDLREFARIWDKNLRAQGYLDRFRAALVN